MGVTGISGFPSPILCYTPRWGGGGYSGFQVTEMIKGLFWVSDLRFWDCVGGSKICKVFFWVAWLKSWYLGILKTIWRFVVATAYSQRHSSTNKVQPNLFRDFFQGLEIWHGIFRGVNFWTRDFFGFCWKPEGFLWVLIFAPIRSSPSLEIWSPPLELHCSVKNSKVLLEGLFTLWDK